MARFFISYRRDDSAGWTGRLAVDLKNRFGEEAVFQDISAIGPGEKFIAAIERSLESCSVVLVVIGREWLLARDSAGSRRLDNPEDPVRLEVAMALARTDRLVIPVLVGGANMPPTNQLPSELRPLADRLAFELSDTRWKYDLAQLAAALAKKARPNGRSWLALLSIALVSIVALLAAIVAVLAAYWYLGGSGIPRHAPPPKLPMKLIHPL